MIFEHLSYSDCKKNTGDRENEIHAAVHVSTLEDADDMGSVATWDEINQFNNQS